MDQLPYKQRRCRCFHAELPAHHAIAEEAPEEDGALQQAYGKTMQGTVFSSIRREGGFPTLNPLEELSPPYSCHQAPEKT